MEITMVFTLGLFIMRLGLLVAGVLFCWFGYRLFAQTNSHGNAEISFKDMIKVNFQHVGPGVFFSLFGTAILVYSIYKPPILDIRTMADLVHYSATFNNAVAPKENSPPSTSSTTSSIQISGAKSETEILDDRAHLGQIREQIGFINRLNANGNLQSDDQPDLGRHAREIKLSLMRSIWNNSWGDKAEFEAWARGKRTGEPNKEARKFYERS